MKTISDLEFKNKMVLLRADINCDVVDVRNPNFMRISEHPKNPTNQLMGFFDKKVLMSERIKESVKTIRELKKKKARVVVIAHQGNPGKDDFVSLKQHAKLLNKFVKISYIDDITGKKAIKAIKKLKPGEAVLLENLRFLEEEQDISKKPNRILKLAELFDIYVNDAFSVCHRKHSSIVLLPRIIKESCAGLLLEKEITALKKISIKDCLYILGGAKPEENIKLLRGNRVLACGLFGQLCLVAKGKNLGYQNEFLKKSALIEDYDSFLEKLREKLANLETPVDFAINVNGKRKEIPLEEFPSEYRIDDIGKKTQEIYVKEIRKAPAIYMKGPAGFAADRNFASGTFAILKAVSECRGFTLIGGGHLSDAIAASKINVKKFGHISLSGGALLSYVAGEKLPGLEALGYYGG